MLCSNISIGIDCWGRIFRMHGNKILFFPSACVFYPTSRMRSGGFGKIFGIRCYKGTFRTTRVSEFGALYCGLGKLCEFCLVWCSTIRTTRHPVLLRPLFGTHGNLHTYLSRAKSGKRGRRWKFGLGGCTPTHRTECVLKTFSFAIIQLKVTKNAVVKFAQIWPF